MNFEKYEVKKIPCKQAKEYIIKKRLDRAAYLLNNSDVSINIIALSVGFSDPLYFSNVFKAAMGVTPSEYIQKK